MRCRFAIPAAISSLIMTAATSLASPSATQIATDVIYGKMLDDHCGTRDATTTMLKRRFDVLEKAKRKDFDKALAALERQYLKLGKDKFCATARATYKNIKFK